MPCIYNDRGLAWRELGNMAQAVQDLTSAMELEAKTEFMCRRTPRGESASTGVWLFRGVPWALFLER